MSKTESFLMKGFILSIVSHLHFILIVDKADLLNFVCWYQKIISAKSIRLRPRLPINVPIIWPRNAYIYIGTFCKLFHFFLALDACLHTYGDERYIIVFGYSARRYYSGLRRRVARGNEDSTWRKKNRIRGTAGSCWMLLLLLLLYIIYVH